MYVTIKLIHQLAVLLSFAGFVARGIGVLRGAAWARSRAARTLPHVVDTILLLSAVALVVLLQLPLAHTPWVLAKIGGLVVYIVLGTIALKRGRSQAVRATAWVAAMLVFAYIVSVAVTKDARGFMAGW